MPPENSEAQRDQEIKLEDMSLKGADKISEMTVHERAKRAMLAEAIEDRIFEYTDILDELVEEDGTVLEDNREEVVETAQQIKGFQHQYNDLVSGNASALLESLDGIGKSSSKDFN
jgi:hypothetical protein